MRCGDRRRLSLQDTNPEFAMYFCSLSTSRSNCLNRSEPSTSTTKEANIITSIVQWLCPFIYHSALLTKSLTISTARLTNNLSLFFGWIFSCRFLPHGSSASVFQSSGMRDSGGCAADGRDSSEKACTTRRRMKEASCEAIQSRGSVSCQLDCGAGWRGAGHWPEIGRGVRTNERERKTRAYGTCTAAR